MRRLPSGLLSRVGSLGRVGKSLAVAGAQRLVQRDEAALLGTQLFDELDRMKGLAMKVGQIVSYMDVGLPEATRERLAVLQHGATALEPDVARALLEEHLGAPLERCFDRLDLVPVAAASIGQVHRGSFAGHEVAVKLRYPDVERVLTKDLGVLRPFSRLASLGTAVDGPALVEDLAARFLAECDYEAEAANQVHFGSFLHGVPGLQVPAVFLERCASGVLTTAWVDGQRFIELGTWSAADRTLAGERLASLPWFTLLQHGVLHADPHPGNFLFTPDAVTVLDFGCVRTFSQHELLAFRALVRAVLSRERAAILETAHVLGLSPRRERLDLPAFLAFLDWIFAPYLTDTFAFTQAWWEEGQRFSRPDHPNLRHLGFPPAWLWLQRTLFGLHAVLRRLEVPLALRPLLEGVMER